MDRDPRLHALIEQAPIAIAMFDRSMRYIAASKRWLRDYGLASPIAGVSHYEVFPDLPIRWKDVHLRALKGEVISSDGDRFDRASGEVRWERWEVQPWRAESGEIGGIIVFSEDISSQKFAEERLLEAQRRLQAIMNAAPIGLSYSDAPDCERITGNPALLSQFEIGPQDNISASAPDPNAAGRKVRMFYEGREVTDGELPLQRAVREQRAIPPMELEVLLPSGRRWFADASGAPILGERGDVLGGVAVTVDITARKRAEEALREADRRKDEFLATLAHELRNPLAPIHNGVEILLRAGGYATDRDRAVLEMMERQVQNLTRLVDDLLEISRISRGKINLREEHTDVASVLKTAMEASQPLVDKGGHTTTIRVPSEPLPIYVDPLRLGQAITNLINNAAKFTPPGGRIDVEAERFEDQAIVRVRDNGCGISPETLPRIFELFAQVDNPSHQTQGGLGIGLALARRLVEMHKGKVEAYSRGLHQGAEFVVTLPLDTEPVPDAVERSAETRTIPTARVLVIDDDRDAADSLCMALETLGATVHVAYSGAEGLGAIQAVDPAVIFLDLGMRGLDGFQTARLIRERENGGKRALVALTGWGHEDAIAKTREAGFDFHLTKPASIGDIERVLCGVHSS